MLLKLSLYLPWLVIVVPLLAARMLAQAVELPPDSLPYEAAPTARLVVLRNGEVLRGNVIASGERVLITLPGREISLRQSDVDVVARTLEEAYLLKRSRVRPTDVDARIDLAAWCLRHHMLASAGEELAAAARVQPFNPRLAALQQRLNKTLSNEAATGQTATGLQSPGPTAVERPTELDVPTRSALSRDTGGSRHSWPPVSDNGHGAQAAKEPIESTAGRTAIATGGAQSPAVLDRFVRSLPSRAVEQFTNSLQPMITQGCATAGCHAPGNASQFTLLRLPQGNAPSRRLTQRNLYNTVQLVDFADPQQSRLLKVASQPHGPLKAGVFGDHRSPKYRDLVAWVSELTGQPLQRGDGAQVIAAGSIFPGVVQPASAEAAFDPLEPNRPAQINSGEPN